MNDLSAIGLGFTTFAAIVLLSQVGVAYPVFRDGVSALFMILFALDAVFALVCLGLSFSNRRIYHRKLGWIRPLIPAICIALCIALAGLIGIWIGG